MSSFLIMIRTLFKGYQDVLLTFDPKYNVNFYIIIFKNVKMWSYLVVIRTLVKGYKNNFESSTDFIFWMYIFKIEIPVFLLWLERYVNMTKKLKVY